MDLEIKPFSLTLYWPCLVAVSCLLMKCFRKHCATHHLTKEDKLSHSVKRFSYQLGQIGEELKLKHCQIILTGYPGNQLPGRSRRKWSSRNRKLVVLVGAGEGCVMGCLPSLDFTVTLKSERSYDWMNVCSVFRRRSEEDNTWGTLSVGRRWMPHPGFSVRLSPSVTFTLRY